MLYTLSGVERSAFERFPMPRNTDIFAPTFNGEGIVRLDDVLADPRYGHSAPYHGMPEGHLPVRSYLAVPVITSDGEVAGGLFFGHPEPGMFSVEDERMVAGIAAQSAIAIENARLYQERTRTAQTLQRALLPPHLPADRRARAGRGLPRRRRGQRGRRRLLRRLPAGRRQLGAGRRRRLRQGPAGRRGDRARPLHAARARRRRACARATCSPASTTRCCASARPASSPSRSRALDLHERGAHGRAGDRRPPAADRRRAAARAGPVGEVGTPLGIIEQPELPEVHARARAAAT